MGKGGSHVGTISVFCLRLPHEYLSLSAWCSVTDADPALPPSLHTSPLAGCLSSSPQSQPELSRNAMPPINLERWYQDIMAAGEPRPCPPPLPAKSFSARRQGQVNSPLLLPHCKASTLPWTPWTFSPATQLSIFLWLWGPLVVQTNFCKTSYC